MSWLRSCGTGLRTSLRGIRFDERLVDACIKENVYDMQSLALILPKFPMFHLRLKEIFYNLSIVHKECWCIPTWFK